MRPELRGFFYTVLASLLLVAALFGAFDKSIWPNGTYAMLRAAVITAIVTAVLGLYAQGAKNFTDNLTATIEHRRRVYDAVFKEYSEQSGQAAYQLIGISLDLQTSLSTWNAARAGSAPQPSPDMTLRVVYSVCRYCEMYARVHMRHTRFATGVIPTGFLFTSVAIENLVWQLMVPPWAFGVARLEDEANACQAVRDKDGQLLSPTQFPGDLNHVAHLQLENAVMRAMANEDARTALAAMMTALNGVLAWAINKVYEPWYGKTIAFPWESVVDLKRLTQQQLDAVGLALPPELDLFIENRWQEIP